MLWIENELFRGQYWLQRASHAYLLPKEKLMVQSILHLQQLPIVPNRGSMDMKTREIENYMINL
jgi:hypothetical protein